jgi:1-phosphatidylinositol-4-phosphate 5-kinase
MENFTHNNESKFEEALTMTLRQKQETGNKKKVKTILRRKYRSIRSDLQAQKKRQRQDYKRGKRLSNGKKERAKDIVHKGHKQFALTWGMMMGVQMSIGRQFDFSTKFNGDIDMRAASLKVADFMVVDKYRIPLKIKGMSSYFKFKDYSPLVFRNLRNFWSVDKYEYMNSICNPDTNFLEFMSNSKSGMYFFISHDKKYMIKTLKDYECKFLRRLLPHYFRHMIGNPNSLINQYYGLHRVKMPHLNRKIHFVVMNNIFHTPKPIHTLYDLKGATYSGRYVKRSKFEIKGSKVCGKDLNFQGFTDDDIRSSNEKKQQSIPEYRQWLKIGKADRKLALADQIASDSVFLAKMKIMDYSLLVGVHGRDPMLVYGYIPQEINNNDNDKTKEVKIPTSLFKRDDGGFWGMNDDGTLNNEIYYIGIIDILQQYDLLKFTENKYKSYLGKDCSTKISALPPQKYAKRFVEFIIDSIK